MARAHLRHALMAGHCKSGVRRWLERYEIDPAEVIGPDAPGIDTERLRSFGAKFTDEIAEIAEREADGRQE